MKIKSHPEYVSRGENEPTAPHDIALVLLDAPVSLDFPTVALAEGAPMQIQNSDGGVAGG